MDLKDNNAAYDKNRQLSADIVCFLFSIIIVIQKLFSCQNLQTDSIIKAYGLQSEKMHLGGMR